MATIPAARRRPLAGRIVVITRSREQAGPLRDLLKRRGADVIEIPTLDVEPAADLSRLDRELGRLERYSAIVLTSRNAVEPVVRRMKHHRIPPHSVPFGAVGPATARAAGEAGLRVRWTAKEFSSEALGRMLARRLKRGDRVLHPGADRRSPDFERIVREAGIGVTNVTVYRLRRPKRPPPKTLACADWITFASAQTARNFAAMVPAELRKRVREIPCACIGPVTARTARDLGFRVVAVPSDATITALVEALCRHG